MNKSADLSADNAPVNISVNSSEAGAVTKNWSLDDIAWQDFDPSRVPQELVPVLKTASLIEYNSADYAEYLCNVFQASSEFQVLAHEWAAEECQHGRALAKWAELADPTFQFAQALATFQQNYRIPVESQESVRGSRAGELVARCVVEAGTSSFYSALADAVDEPVLKQICRNIAADEIRHYKLFLSHLGPYAAAEKMGVFGRLRVALGRFNEVSDDELARAYHSACCASEPYDLKKHSTAYLRLAYGAYRESHIRKALRLITQAVGLGQSRVLTKVISKAVYGVIKIQFARWSKQDSQALAA